MNYKDIFKRAGKTFVQSFLASWGLTQFDIEKGAVIGALAAGISAAMNIVIALNDGVQKG